MKLTKENENLKQEIKKLESVIDYLKLGEEELLKEFRTLEAQYKAVVEQNKQLQKELIERKDKCK